MCCLAASTQRGRPMRRVLTHGSLENQGARVLGRSDVLELGFGNGPVSLADGNVIKGKADHARITAAQWKKVPEWLDNPAAVFDSDTSTALWY